jgi:DUF1707 SHOCT-like domain
MTTNDTMRASDKDREHAVEILRTHYADGRLTLEEFDERVAAAYEGKTWGDLRYLTRDLPGGVGPGPDPAAQAAPSSTAPVVPPPAQPAWLPTRLFPLVPALLAFLIISSFAWGGMGHSGDRHFSNFGFFPIVPLLVFLVFFLGRSGRRRGRRRGGYGPYR